jgi:[acyl-carrier-protein] S-malonyltransferase
VTLAILCSGQGHQDGAMFDLIADAAAAQPLFQAAARLLNGEDPRELVRRGDAELLTANRTAQILCTLQALALRAALGDAFPERRLIAGYSVGEIAAWALADFVSPTEALALAATRARAMDAASHDGDGLAFIRGLAPEAMRRFCKETGVEVAIVNPDEGYVIGGDAPALARAEEMAAAAGANRFKRLPVRTPSHTSRLAPAAAEFARALERADLARAAPPGVRLYSGLDGAPVFDVAEGLRKFAGQVSQTVHWQACLQACVEGGASAFLETGPGSALSAMAGALSGAPARSASDFRTLEGLRRWLAAALAS